MKHRHTRIAVAAVATLGLAMGATVIGAGSAQAVSSLWQCHVISSSGPGVVLGYTCVGSGGGTGWFVLEPAGTIEYRCTGFSATLVSPGDYTVTGTGCNNGNPMTV